MKAIVYHKYGSPEVLKMEEWERPHPGENEVLLKVVAVSVNPYEWHYMRGEPFIARFSGGLLRPRNKILGSDVAGRVEAVGKGVTMFKAGDEVFGFGKFGGLAEFVCVPQSSLLLKPKTSTFEDVATLPIAGITALKSVRDSAGVKPGQSVLINGSSGGVGIFTVQIAKLFGARITAVCSGRNESLVRRLGADDVIDYAKEDFRENGKRYDSIIDNVGNCSLSDVRNSLAPGGVGVVVGFTTMANALPFMLPRPFEKNKIGILSWKFKKEDLNYLASLLEEKKIVSVIDKRFSLEQTPDAIRYLEEGHARGKVVINVQREKAFVSK